MYCVCVSSKSERAYVWIVMQCNRASIYVSMCGRAHVCMYVCAYASTCVCVDACVCACMYVFMLCIVYVCASTSERAYLWIVMQCNRASIYLFIYASLCWRAYVCVHVCMYARMRICVYVCVYVCMCV